VRKFRNGDLNRVTPKEFRLLLVKFGVTFNQATTDSIFKEFDSNNSGSIELEEFGAFIMNADFKPKFEKVKKAKFHVDDHITHPNFGNNKHVEPHFLHNIHHEGYVRQSYLFL